jgi:hypothetical protein
MRKGRPNVTDSAPIGWVDRTVLAADVAFELAFASTPSTRRTGMRNGTAAVPAGSPVASLRGPYRSNRSTRIAVNWLLGTCLVLIAVSVAIDLLGFLGIWMFPTSAFSLTIDRSIPEFYGYLMSLIVVVCLGLAFRRTRLTSTAFVAALYGFIVIDDAFEYHEFGGAALVDLLGLGTGVLPIIFGELLAWGLAALALGVFLLWCLRRRQPADLGVYLLFALILVATTVFGAGVDALHVLTSSSVALGLVLGWVEDGGELLMLTVAAACALLLLPGASDTAA